MKEDKTMDNTLVILAAGIGNRYGGAKQITPVGPCGEKIIDFSIYDAWKAGFKKVVFIIRKNLEKDFREVIGDRVAKHTRLWGGKSPSAPPKP